ncbi:MAG TPA: hypothetical protein VKU00_19940 [Chthonomonadaceae bacterium]|nr:hypothetical protein [Chthonomonadaceae bacterium]
MLRVLETDGQPAPEEWVTIREAARRLSLSERQVRRLAQRLPDADRRVVEGSPACVRFSALLDRRRPDIQASASTKEPDTGPSSVRPESGVVSDQQATDLLEQLRSEVAFLRARLEAAAVVEAERGEDGGLSEILTGYAEQREMEVFGPAGLEG